MRTLRSWFSKRWLIGYVVFLICSSAAVGIVIYAGMESYSTPVLFIFMLGYIAGRISKAIEQRPRRMTDEERRNQAYFDEHGEYPF